MSLDTYTIVISGLGGQGSIRLIQILGNALMAKGYEVVTSETHGLSQRGGKVVCFLRFGAKKSAPIPMIGTADMIITMEESSILDMLKYAKPDKTTKIIISSYEKQIRGIEYPSLKYVLDSVFEISDHIYIIPPSDIAKKQTGNIKTMNIVLLGYILRFLPLNKKDIEQSLASTFSGNTLEMNLKAFNGGFKLK
ncbi:MAG: 2-oxoacid:acceptor oxidoreductase family protein [Candidatus Hodarchaeota archaeon]